MASARYTLNIEPEEPEEPLPEMTPKKKWEHFWFYYKWHTIAAVIGVILIAVFIRDMVTRVDPDYQIAIFNDYSLPQGVAENLETALADFFDDRNGDGKVVVSVMSYILPHGGADDSTDPQTHMANVTRLMSDASTGESVLFLTKYPADYQAQYDIFAYNDGTNLVEGGAIDTSRLGVLWSDCPVLTGIELGEAEYFGSNDAGTVQDYLQDFYLVKRAFTGTSMDDGGKKAAYYESTMQVYDVLTAGAA